MATFIKVKSLGAEVPSRSTEGSAGFDLTAFIEEPVTLEAGECKLIPTGLAIHIDNSKVVSFILPRSKAGAKRGLVVGNLTGVIDSDYQGQWMVAAWNRNFAEPLTIEPGEAIAQAVFLNLAAVCFEEVTDFDEETERNSKGISDDPTSRR